MSVLVVNCGSSSVKYAVIDLDDRRPRFEGQVERIGSDVAGHAEALRTVETEVSDHLAGSGAGALTAVGHRVVHGGTVFTEPTVLDDDVIVRIEELAVLAPLHNPANVLGIRSAREAFGDVPHVAVFDTAFHATLPAAARSYAVPREWEHRYGVRRYGFHGTSHAYVSRRTAQWLQAERGVDPLRSRIVVLHLGNGASACAVLGGRSIDTSMGLTPLAGLVMGTRSGDIDPAVFGHLDRVAGMAPADVETALNRESGLRGLAGESDLRAVSERADAGDTDAALALDVYCHRTRHYLGAYAVALGGLDAIAFTAGVGEHSVGVRRRVLTDLDWLGIALDPVRNAGPGGGMRLISADDGAVAALVVPTDEAGEIASQVAATLRR